MKKFLLICALLFPIYVVASEDLIIPKKIKLYAFYTPSHKVFIDNWFLPSIKDDFEVILECHDQECESAAFMKAGWVDTMLHKVDIIIRGIEENWGSFFIHSDVDIQFFKPIEQDVIHYMKKYDIVIQKNDPFKKDGCAGFFFCRANEKTLKLWKSVRQFMVETGNHDQNGLNYFLKENNIHKVSWRLLPNEFFCAGTITGKPWNPGKKLVIPDGIKIHHANWTIGIRNKIAQLKYVKNLVRERERGK